MTAISINPLAGGFPAVQAHHRRWPWITTLAILIAFLLAVHDPYASREWQKTIKADVNTLSNDEANGRIARELGFLFLGAIGLVLIVRPSPQTFRPNPAILFPFCMVILWAFLSIAWSADIAITLKRQVILVCFLMAVVGTIRQFDVHTMIEMAFVHTLAIVLIGIGAELMFAPHLSGGDEYRFAGTLHPNHAALNASFLLLSSLYLARHRKNGLFLIVAAAAFVLVVLTKSRTGLSSCLAASAVFVLATRTPRQRVVIAIAAIFVLGASLVIVATDIFPGLGQMLLLDRRNSDPTTLTGRTFIWQFVLSYISVDWGTFLSGFGYGGFWTKATAVALSSRTRFKLAEAHNDYLEVISQVGLVGLFLYLWGLVVALWTSIKQVRCFGSFDAAFAISLIVMAFVHSIAESAMTLPVFTTLIFWSILGCAALRGLAESEVGGIP
jgi:O-antigen ligase